MHASCLKESGQSKVGNLHFAGLWAITHDENITGLRADGSSSRNNMKYTILKKYL
jgi:hypothetical protein